MKPKIKFGFIDILLCILLVVALAVNIWAYTPKEADAVEKEKIVSHIPDATGSSKGSSASGEYLKALSPDDLEGKWEAKMVMYSDMEMVIPYATYEMEFNISHEVDKEYAISVTTKDSRYADVSVNPDVPPEGFAPALIEGEIFAELDENGMFSFKFSVEEEKVFSIAFMQEEGVLTGTAYRMSNARIPEEEMYTYLVMTKCFK